MWCLFSPRLCAGAYWLPVSKMFNRIRKNPCLIYSKRNREFKRSLKDGNFCLINKKNEWAPNRSRVVGPMNAIFKKLITYGYPKLCDVFLYNSKWKIIRNKATKCDRLFIALAHTIWWNPMNASKLYLSICCCCCCLLVLLNECCLIKSVGQFQQGIFLEKPPLISHIDPATFFSNFDCVSNRF